MKILVGADPELFVTRKGELVSGYGIVPGTKQAPFKVDKGAVQVDGMALEFNIDPAEDEDSFVVNIDTVMAQLKAMVPEHDFSIVPVAHFGAEMIESQPEEAKMLGCDPDFNAWEDGAANPKPDGSFPFRTASGHIHVGWTSDANPFSAEHTAACHGVVKMLDLYLGVPSLLYDKDNLRRSMYGKAGCYRPKTYGVEYRVLSNAWLKDGKLKRWVYRSTIKAVNALINGAEPPPVDVADVINSNDEKKAVALIKKYKLEMPYAA